MEIKRSVSGEGSELGLGRCIPKCSSGIAFVLIYVHIIYTLKKIVAMILRFLVERFLCGQDFDMRRFTVYFLFDKVCTQICNNNIKRDK